MENIVFSALSFVTAITFLTQIFMLQSIKTETCDYGNVFIIYLVFVGFILLGFKG